MLARALASPAHKASTSMDLSLSTFVISVCIMCGLVKLGPVDFKEKSERI